MKPLVLHLKREYWEAIRQGHKTEEYRERGPYWERRLRNKEFSEIVLFLGYPIAGDESKTLRRKWKGYIEKNITHPLFGENMPVFAIDVSEQSCKGCKHDIPGDCAKREIGDDGYKHFPEGECRK